MLDCCIIVDITPVEAGNDRKAVQETPEKTVSEETITTPLPLVTVQVSKTWPSISLSLS